jgi:hypothetical protein
MAQPAEFKAVPFNPEWINHDKIDIHAIYRRPILDDTGEHALDDHGVPRWDLTGGLPVRRHQDWLKKGFEYVTLANPGALGNKVVVQLLRQAGHEPRDFIMLRNRMVGATPWNPQLYLASQSRRDRAQSDDLRDLVEKLGSEAVRDVIRATRNDPGFELPAHLQHIAAGGTVRLPTPAPTPTPAPAAPAPALPRVAKNSLAGRQRKKAARKAVGAPKPTPAAAEVPV